jgi:heme-binding NEAT domain protein
LRKRLRDFSPKKISGSQKAPRSLAQLRQRAEILQTAEQKRQAEAARRKHIQEMEAVSGRENQVWNEVEHQLEHGRRIASVYDTVTEQLAKLQQLAEYKNKQFIFHSRVKELAQRYASRKALIRRWSSKGWV